MQIREVMTSDVRLVDPGTTLKDAAQMMREGDFGLLPIGENDRLIGTITDRDITIRAVASGKDPNSTTVRDAMSQGIFYCFEDQSVDEVAAMMGDKQVRRMPVLNRDKRLVGIVALGDLATEHGADDDAGEALSESRNTELAAGSRGEPSRLVAASLPRDGVDRRFSYHSG